MAGNAYLTVLTSGARSLVRAIQTSAGAGDASKIVALNTAGKIDSSMLPTSPGGSSPWRLQSINSTPATMPGTVADLTDFGRSVTIPANTLQVNSVIEIEWSGVGYPTSSNDSFLFFPNLNDPSHGSGDFGINGGPYSSGYPMGFVLRAQFLTNSIGTSGTYSGGFWGQGGSYGASHIDWIGSATNRAIDTTADNVFGLAGRWNSGSSAAATFALFYTTLKVS